jgi:hypothetical protein
MRILRYYLFIIDALHPHFQFLVPVFGVFTRIQSGNRVMQPALPLAPGLH